MFRNRKLLLGMLIVFLIVMFIIIFRNPGFDYPSDQIRYEQTYRVVSVIDGDTFQIGTGEIVRLICVDAPEFGEAGYVEATQYLSELILDRDVMLESDVSDRDSYGRLLRYVYSDGIFVNREVVKSGHAEVFPYGEDTERCEEIGL